MLDNLVKKIPKTLFAIICISGAIVYIMYNDPPHQFCDTQIDNFKAKQVEAILPKTEKLFVSCKKTVLPGACYEYFSYLNRLLRDFNLISQECLAEVASIDKVRSHLLNGINLMTQLAWRKEVLQGTVSKMNWLSASDMSLFCKLKKKTILLYGSQSFKAFEAKVIAGLPTDNPVNPKDIRKNSILSENCAKYP